jgi:hypothetical protein
MADSVTVRDLLAHQAAQTFVGRSKELASLSDALEASRLRPELLGQIRLAEGSRVFPPVVFGFKNQQ